MDNWNLLSDYELIDLIVKEKKTPAFAVLYNRYKNKVFGRCMSFIKNIEDAEDLTHDIFLLTFFKLSTFGGKSSFSSWLYSITYNFCINFIQRNTSAQISKNSISVDNFNDMIPEPTDEEIFQIPVDQLKKALDSIKPEDKKILLLKYQDEASIEELQVLLELKKSAVKMRLKRAKAQLKEEYLKINKL